MEFSSVKSIYAQMGMRILESFNNRESNDFKEETMTPVDETLKHFKQKGWKSFIEKAYEHGLHQMRRTRNRKFRLTVQLMNHETPEESGFAKVMVNVA